MAITKITWCVSEYTLTYYNPYSRKVITRGFDEEKDLIEFINKHEKIKQFAWYVKKETYAIIEED